MIPRVLLSFDVEEFDLPREHGGEILVKEGVRVSSEGLSRVLEVLERKGVPATMFTTGNFARENPEILRKAISSGHEIAAHGVDHFSPKPSDFAKAKAILEKSLEVQVRGFRAPRMQKIDYEELSRVGYSYDSSANPAFIPGRYNNFKVSREPFFVEASGSSSSGDLSSGRILEIPTGVATELRIPLFWLSLHLFPLWFYVFLAKKSLRETGVLAIYFHPWEFGEIRGFSEVPRFIKINSGKKLAQRLEKVIDSLLEDGAEFLTYGEFTEKFPSDF